MTTYAKLNREVRELTDAILLRDIEEHHKNRKRNS